jgi:GNAT superfamily N-acetyltransferase
MGHFFNFSGINKHMKIIIRDAELSDLQTVQTLIHEQTQYHAAILPDIIQVFETADMTERLEIILNQPDQRLMVAVADNRIIGMIEVMIKSNPPAPMFKPRRFVLINDIIVTESARRLGIGKRLMKATEAWALENDINEIELNVWEKNANALVFYEKYGFTTERRGMRRVISK